MAYNYRFGTKLRDQTWALEKLAAYKAGRGELPICVHCDEPVKIGDAWDVAHVDIPRAFGGKSVGCAHRKHNQEDNNKVVTPAFAKAERVRKNHVGITGPGLGEHPMQAGRRSLLTKTMRHGVRPRLTQAQRHRDFIAKRYFVEVEDFSEPLEVQP